MGKHFEFTDEFVVREDDLLSVRNLFDHITAHRRIKILVVVDGGIGTDPATSFDFGIGTAIKHVADSHVGAYRFSFDIARRAPGSPTVVTNPVAYQPRYQSFRFDMTDGGDLVIDRYHQIWLFGINPGNAAPGEDPDDDGRIDAAGQVPATDAELQQLARWMRDNKGGIFATGDHDILGASMCRNVPRVRTMRRWTNADGVPPIGGIEMANTADRIDTLRPPGPDFEPAGTGVLENSAHQGDLTPQPIHWVEWQRDGLSILNYKARPHQVLCHPALGPIDVMPDHAHEGLCRDTGTVPTGGKYDFGDGEWDEYPDAVKGGTKPAPRIIAYGSTLADPPYRFAKGPQSYRRRFPMVSVYDGHIAGVGRVAVDSTWHHWMGINIDNMKAEDGDHWSKIGRYYVNLAVWLSAPGAGRWALISSTLAAHFTWVGYQEFAGHLSDVELGRALYPLLAKTYGPCWVTQHIVFNLHELELILQRPDLPFEPQCLTCPPLRLLEYAALGGMVRASMPVARAIQKGSLEDKAELRVDVDALATSMLESASSSVIDALEDWRRQMRATDERLERMTAGFAKAD